MKKRLHNTDHEVDYWQSNADLMTGLVLIFMLISVMLLLYVVQISDAHELFASAGQNGIDGEYDRQFDGAHGGEGPDDWHDERTDSSADTDDHEDNNSSGGGGSESTDNDEDDLWPIKLNAGEDWKKAAVFVTVVDQESQRAVRIPGITFELYERQTADDGGSIRSLNTYYPEKVVYKSFETTDAGTYYLPEKIETGLYYLKQISGIDGYDLVEETPFEIDQTYDWPDPFMVSVEVSPAKNIIQTRMEDAQTHLPVTGGTMKVIAAEDIVTADDSTRFVQGEQADTIEYDKEGTGNSGELFLGTYTIVQDEIPPYYAAVEEPVEWVVDSRQKEQQSPYVFSVQKTELQLLVRDDYYENQAIEGARFELRCSDQPDLTQTGQTNAQGELTFTNLEKNTLYTLVQTASADDYDFDDHPLEIAVTADGRIDGEPVQTERIVNYMGRLEVDLLDQLFKTSLPDRQVSLFRENGTLVASWTTEGAPKLFEGLDSGAYYLQVQGKSGTIPFEFDIDDRLQTVVVPVWSWQSLLSLAGGGLLFLGAIVLLVRLLRSSGQKRRGSGGSSPDNSQEVSGHE